MNTKKRVSRIMAGLIVILMGYLCYELILELSSSPDGIQTQGWVAIFITALMLLILTPLTCYLWRCDRRGIIDSILFFGTITIFILVSKLSGFISPQLEHIPSMIRLVVIALLLIVSFLAPLVFYRWVTKKLLGEEAGGNNTAATDS